MYYDKNNKYPSSASCGGPNLWATASSGWCNSEGTEHDSDTRWIKDGGVGSPLADFIAKDPFDPKHDGTPVSVATEPGSYAYWAGGNACGEKKGHYYVLVFALEQKGSQFEKDRDVPKVPMADPACNYTWDGSNNNGVVMVYRIQ